MAKTVHLVLAAPVGASVGSDWTINGVVRPRRSPGTPIDLASVTTVNAFKEMLPTDAGWLSYSTIPAGLTVTNVQIGASGYRVLLVKIPNVADSDTCLLTYVHGSANYAASLIEEPVPVDSSVSELAAVRAIIAKIAEVSA